MTGRTSLLQLPAVMALVGALSSAGCGSLEGVQTAEQVRAIYDSYEADMKQLGRLENAGATPELRTAARQYRNVLATRSAAMLVNSALEFGTTHGGGVPLPVPDLGGLLGSMDLARSRFLLAIAGLPSAHRNDALACIRAYDQCIEQPQDMPLACNHSLLSCLSDRLTASKSSAQ
jgi:hypothetical protein